MNRKWMSLIITVATLVAFVVMGLACASSQDTQSEYDSRTENRQQYEYQDEKANRLILADQKKLVTGSDNKTTTESIEAVFQPQVITGIGEITDAKLSEPGRPYYFKLRAIYKGHDANAKRILLQDLGTQSDVGDAAWGAAFGIDTNVYPIQCPNNVVSTLPTEANTVATFYIIAVRFTEQKSGWRGNEIQLYARFVRNIEKSAFDPSKFVVASGMHYITVNDARVTTQEDVMAAYFFGSAASNSSGNIFDPIIYPLVDLMTARAEMNKKDIRNNNTFPTVRIKYVSEVIFRGQSNTTITVSTADNVLTERMDFTGRAYSVTNGARIRVYYTIAKDPTEKWEIQAIEKL
jgi:hypothetical protein